MSNFHLSEDRDHIGRQMSRELISHVWTSGAHAARARHGYKPAGDLGDDPMTPELTYCVSQEHRCIELQPEPGSTRHLFWCDICRISFTLHD